MSHSADGIACRAPDSLSLIPKIHAVGELTSASCSMTSTGAQGTCVHVYTHAHTNLKKKKDQLLNFSGNALGRTEKPKC